MKYLLLIYSHPSHVRRVELFAEIVDSGELVMSEVLADPVHVRTVGGPFREAKERPTGFFVVDCESRDRALEIAHRFPEAGFAGAEIHPIMDAGSGDV